MTTCGTRSTLFATSLLSVLACGTPASLDANGPASASAAQQDSSGELDAPPAKSPLETSKRCDGTDIFVKNGLYNDLKAAVDPRFSPHDYVDIPGVTTSFHQLRRRHDLHGARCGRVGGACLL